MTAPQSFADRLSAAIARTGAPACVGIDPVREKLPPEVQLAAKDDDLTGFRAFSRGIVDAVADLVPAVKFQSACFERYGDFGMLALIESMAYAKERGLIVILDAKRGDIGISADHYAHAAFSVAKADALTVNAYLGADTLEPYLKYPGVGLFVLVRTSNPGSDAIQSQRLADGRTIAQLVAATVASSGKTRKGLCGLSNVGAVVGATKPADAQSMREAMPDTIFLIPGYGAQGGTIDDIRQLVRPGQDLARQGILVTASRSVIYPQNPIGSSWKDSVRQAAADFSLDLAAIRAD